MIEARGLVKRHGAVEVLRGITLRVARGEVAAIVGPSGGGKSTFLRCLNGLERFEGGSITIDGLDLDATLSEPRARRPCGRSGGGSGWFSRGSTCSRIDRRWAT